MSTAQQNESPRHEPSVVLPLVAILIAVAVPVGFAVLSAAGGGIVAVAFGILATVAILFGLLAAMQRIMGEES